MDKKEIHPQLQSFEPIKYSDKIERIWLGEDVGAGTELFIPPTQFVDLIFPLDGSIIYHNGIKYTAPYLEGIMFKPVKFQISGSVLGVRFMSFGWYPFSSINGIEIVNKLLPMYFSKHDAFEIERICNSKDIEKSIFYIYRMLSNLFDEERNAKIEIVKKYYNNLVELENPLPLKEYCDSYNFNYNTLNRAFKTVVGMSPKKFARLISFRKAFDMIIKTKLSLTEIAFESGYFDQPHFVREFKYFSGCSPYELRQKVNNTDSYLARSNQDFSSF